MAIAHLLNINKDYKMWINNGNVMRVKDFFFFLFYSSKIIGVIKL